MTGFILVLTSQIQTGIGRRTGRHHQRQRQHQLGKGESHISRTVAQITNALTDKDLVYQIIDGIDQHRNNTRNRIGQQKLTDLFRT